ncbi:CehA/McbA family metallohydrolase [Ruminiclostridium cellulolyticum]|uniref:CehA/McbA family metallohydrolase n=1 Tax=Ruminiclostridium cellulolyticum TaxID=1521 RepID=UPI0000E8FF1B|nr:CehA/McbA family metallohydrolase [Ruminiclostridium cellulolyticum]
MVRILPMEVLASGNSISTSHSVYLTGLVANTTYHFTVQSTNLSSLSSTSSDYTFTTLSSTPPNKDYNFYFGQLHSHTSNSDGQGTYSSAYTYARDTAKLDFFAITDHSNNFDNYTDWTKSQEWANMKNTANSFNKDGVFAAIAGFEMTWSNGTGHMNTFNTEWFESRLTTGMNLQTYYNKIAADTGSISQWNHPGTKFGDFNNFGYYSAATDKAIKLIEVGNGAGVPGSSSYYPSYSYYTTALDKGWHVAPSNNQDNHSTNWGTSNDCRTVILATSLTRKNVFEAIRNLRVYASEDKDLEISFSINNSIMGSTLSNPSTLNISITGYDSEASDTISKIELISDGGIVSASKIFSSNNVSWNPQLASKYKYYYVRITEKDGNIAVTAPIWTGK